MPDRRATYCATCRDSRRSEQNRAAGRAFRARAGEHRVLARQGLLWTLPASAQGSQTRTEAITLSGAQILEIKAVVADLAGARARLAYVDQNADDLDEAWAFMGYTSGEAVRILMALLPVTRRKRPTPDFMAQAIREAAEAAAREVLRSAGRLREPPVIGSRPGTPQRPGGR